MTSKILALKYRPQKFSEVKGQEHIVNTLKIAIAENSLPHSIIFSGIRGTGKTTLARLVAKRLNCENPVNGEICDVCNNCLAIKNGKHLDVLEIDGASYTGIDNIREIIEASQYKAVMGKYRVFIIDEAHMLSKNAFNALLKNLEEPADHVCYILATTELHKIPDTILSRCMRCQMSMFSVEELVSTQKELLDKENIAYDESSLFDIAYAADGSMRDAQTLLNQILLLSHGKLTKETTSNILGLGQRQDLYTLLEYLLCGEVEPSLVQFQKITKQGILGHMLLSQLMDLIYWLCCIKSTPTLKLEKSYPDLERVKGSMLADQIGLPKLHMVWQILQKGYQEYMSSPLKGPTLEMVLMRLCFIQDLKFDLVATNTQIEEPKQWKSWDVLLRHIRQHKEPVLYEQLAKTYNCISYQQGNLILSGPDNKTLVSEIINKLNQLTGISWRVTIKNGDGTSSTAPHNDPQTSLPQTTDPELPDVVADLAQTFPDMVVTVNA